MKTPLPLALSLLAAPLLAAAPTPATAAPQAVHAPRDAPREARMGWFREAKFGLFIHWGPYSAMAGEWDGRRDPEKCVEWILQHLQIPVSRYKAFTRKHFTASKFDAKAWVAVMKSAGVRYVVVTSKHHDGFAMWDSKVSDWDTAATAIGKRDMMGELKAECERAGIRFCLYHSILDWAHPDYAERRAWNDEAAGKPADMNRYVDGHLIPQLGELLERYDPALLWFDGEWEGCYTAPMADRVQNFLRAKKPALVINNRVGKDRKGFDGDSAERHFGDYFTPEQKIPANGFGPGVDWESCMTMNDTWGFSRHDTRWKSSEAMIRQLVDCASKGGNYLLNIGPDGDGVIPEASVKRLGEIGAWLKVNGESVYGTGASPFKQTFDWGRVTAKGDTLYLHVWKRPEGGILRLPTPVPENAVLLADGRALDIRLDRSCDGPACDAGIALSLPEKLPDATDTVIRLRYKFTPPAKP